MNAVSDHMRAIHDKIVAVCTEMAALRDVMVDVLKDMLVTSHKFVAAYDKMATVCGT
jgi:hypothetical protein